MRFFEAVDFLAATTTEDALLASPLRLAPDSRLEQRFETAGGGWQLAGCEVNRAEGLLWAAEVDHRLAVVMGACDGERPLRDALASADLADGETTVALAAVRTLIERGFLLRS